MLCMTEIWLCDLLTSIAKSALQNQSHELYCNKLSKYVYISDDMGYSFSVDPSSRDTT